MNPSLQAIRQAAGGEQLLDALARHLLEESGTVGQIHGIGPDELEALYAFAHSLYNQARWPEALSAFNFLSIQDHLDRRHHMGRGACLQMLRRHEEALRAYSLAFLLEMTDPVVSFHIGECLIALGRREDAQVALDAAADAAADAPACTDVGERALALLTLLKRKEQT
jgi:type III secretion system low calcium response chaperone LcrH/SycD